MGIYTHCYEFLFFHIREWVAKRSSPENGQKEKGWKGNYWNKDNTLQMLIYEKYFNILMLSVFWVYTRNQMV